jgi:hypothetical protein
MDTATLRKISYRLPDVEPTDELFKRHADMFIKQGQVYFSLLSDDREHIVSSQGLDTSDARKLAEFLYYEAVAMGCNEAYLSLLHELLLIPPGAESIYTALVQGMNY